MPFFFPAANAAGIINDQQHFSETAARKRGLEFMKKRKMVLFCVFTLLFSFLITACNVTPQPSTSSNTTGSSVQQTTAGNEDPNNTDPTEPTEPAVDPRKAQCQYVPAEVTSPEGIPVLKWVCLRDEWNHMWTEDAAVELNQMLADRNMPFRVQFVILTYYVDDIYAAPPTSPYVDWFSMPEVQEILKDADLIYGALSGQEMTEYLVPITDNVSGTASPSLQNAVPHDYNWLTQTVDGEIYGIPSGPSQGTTTGWIIKSSFYKKMGLKEADLSRNFWEMDTLFAKLYQKNSNKPFLTIREGGIRSIAEIDETTLPQQLPSSIADFMRGTYTCIGSCFGIDASSGSPKVVNMMETDTVRLYQEAMFRYKSAGYVTADEAEAQIRYGSGLADFSYAEYGSSNSYYPVTDPVLSSTRPSGYTIGVAASSQNPDAGKALLALITEDEAFRIQLLFGKEGRDYTAVNGNYRTKSQADGSSYSMRFLSPLSYFSGFASEGAIYAEEGKTELETFREMLDQSTLYHPIVFDYSGLKKELAAVQAVINRFFPYFTTTEEIPDDMTTEVEDTVPIMNEAGYDQMLQAFKDAGSDKIVEELQRQLDAWLAENPDW